jgi:hypothetical protein
MLGACSGPFPSSDFIGNSLQFAFYEGWGKKWSQTSTDMGPIMAARITTRIDYIPRCSCCIPIMDVYLRGVMGRT